MVSDGKKSEYKSDLPIVIYGGIKSKIYSYYQDKKRNYSLLALGLYVYLYDAARIQNNIRVWLTDGFIRKATGVGQDTLTSIKKDLIAMELIDIHHEKKEDGTFGKRYIEVKFVWKREAARTLFHEKDDSQTEYKILKTLLKNGFRPYDQMKSAYPIFFSTKLKGIDVELEADLFHFDDKFRLIANAKVAYSDGLIKYTIPRDRIKEVMERIASSYRYQLSDVFAALKSPP